MAKLQLSYQLVSIAGIDLDPTHSENFPRKSHLGLHVALTQSIVLAYAAIEDLGLHVRASQNKPRTINGQWNPEVRGDLETRLTTAGVRLSELFLWSSRGNRSVLDQKMPMKIAKRVPWACWNIRDGKVELVDAIAHVSWLRSHVASHGSKHEFLKVLSVYEVTNAQFLARRLLLESLGFWRSAMTYKTNTYEENTL